MTTTAFDLIARSLTIALFLARLIYWLITSRRSHAQKPRTKPRTLADAARYGADAFVTVLVYAQLLGLRLIPFAQHAAGQLIGLVLVVTGFIVSISARRTLGANWTHGAQYQIKTGQELVTGGIYRYIRHPIYSGIFASLIGAELVAGSYLVIPLTLILAIVAQHQAGKEEAILSQAFGDHYRTYMKTTKRFIPYFW